MALGPVEIVVFALPDKTLGERVLGEIRSLVAGGAVRIVDTVVVTKDSSGAITWSELVDDESDWDELLTASELAGLIAEEDVTPLVAELTPGSSALVLAFENTWLVSLLAAVRDSGGELIAEVAVPDSVVQDVVNSASAENGKDER